MCVFYRLNLTAFCSIGHVPIPRVALAPRDPVCKFQESLLTQTPLRLVLLLACLLPVGFAQAQDSSSPDVPKKNASVLTLGLGGALCEAYIQERQPQNLKNYHHYQQISWVQGYLAGLDHSNPSATQTYELINLEGWIESYCKAHSASTLLEAATEFYAQLGGRPPAASNSRSGELVKPDHS
jgi:hypothetical protein